VQTVVKAKARYHYHHFTINSNSKPLLMFLSVSYFGFLITLQ
jgi:hypothetical protein